MENDFIVSVDIGTVKTRILVSEICQDGEIKIIGAVTNPSSGVSKGRVADPETLSEVVRLSREEAERMSGVEIEGACVSMSNADIKSFDSRGMLTTGGDEGVTEDDISQVTRNAQNIPLPSDRMVLHPIQQFFTVDGEGGIVNPLGRKASRLERDLHIITILREHHRALKKTLKSCGIEVIEMAFAPIAVSRLALNYTDREEGSLVIDIGGEVTSYVYYYGGVVRSSGVLPVGGFNVSNDMAIGLGLPFGVAEALKRKAGVGGAEARSYTVDLSGGGRSPAGSNNLDSNKIAEVVQPRCRELFALISEGLSSEPRFGMMRGRIVLSGGGSMLKGIERIAEEVFSREVSKAVPAGFSGLSEMLDDESWDTAAGLLLVGREKLERCEYSSSSGYFDWFRQGLRKVVETF